MAGGMDLGNGGKGGKKPLDTTINLVPFIDLMAVIIAFLMMTAVWTQLGRLQVSSSGQNGGEEAPPDPNQVNITLLLTEKELKLTVGATQMDPIAITRQNGRIDLGGLNAKLKDVKAQMPDKSNLTLQIEDKVRYEDVVRIIDGCIGAEFPAVAVSAAT